MKLKKVGALLLPALLAVISYIILHESGHMVVMLSAGAAITDFSILTAHVSGVGGNYTNLSDLWLHANGAFLPVIVALVYMLCYKASAKSVFYHLFSYLFSLVSFASVLAWVFVPILYMQGDAPAGDDVTSFLYNFSQEHHPLMVSAAAVIILAAGVTILIQKGIFRNFIKIVRNP